MTQYLRLTIAILCFISMLLTGCSTYKPARVPSSDNYRAKGIAAGAAAGGLIGGAVGAATIPIGAAVGGVIGGAFADDLQRSRSLVRGLEGDGVNIIEQGEKLTLVLPSDLFFYEQSPRINPNYKPVLDNVAKFLLSIPKVSIQVAGYSDDTGSRQRKMALTRARAQNIADYLWRQGIDTRILVAYGYGDALPISDNGSKEGRSQNRRVEISLQRLPG